MAQRRPGSMMKEAKKKPPAGGNMSDEITMDRLKLVAAMLAERIQEHVKVIEEARGKDRDQWRGFNSRLEVIEASREEAHRKKKKKLKKKTKKSTIRRRDSGGKPKNEEEMDPSADKKQENVDDGAKQQWPVRKVRSAGAVSSPKDPKAGSSGSSQNGEQALKFP